LNAKPKLQWQILNKNFIQKCFFKCVSFKSKIFQQIRIFPEAPGDLISSSIGAFLD
jgi:hypothetical protein